MKGQWEGFDSIGTASRGILWETLRVKLRSLTPPWGDVKGLRTQLIQSLMTGIPGFQEGRLGCLRDIKGMRRWTLRLWNRIASCSLPIVRRLSAKAKESAGNLTGTGYNNILGQSLASSLAGENAQLAQLGMQNQQFQFQQATSVCELTCGTQQPARSSGLPARVP